MAHIKSYLKLVQVFSSGLKIFLNLRKELKKNYIDTLEFPEKLRKEYYYHSKFYNRTKQYIHANHFFGELLCLVRGHQMKKSEMQYFILLSSCAPLFDDFFENKTDDQSLKHLMHQPDINQAKSDAEILAALFFGELVGKVSHQKNLLDAADFLFDAQVKSKNQENTKLSKHQLLHISKDKGGYSGLMYAHILESEKTDLFLKLAFDLGSYGQLMDDIFDLYDDAKAGIRTFANQAQTIAEIRLIIEEHEEKLFSTLSQMHLLGKDKIKFEQVLIVFSSIIEIALNKYEKIEAEMQISPINCLQLDRKEWVIDMEKASNLWKLFKLSADRI